MSFSADFLEACGKPIRLASLETDFASVKLFIDKAIANLAKKNKNVQAKLVKVYMHGSYVNKTNIAVPSKIEIMVELTSTPSFKPDKITSNDYELVGNYYIVANLEYTVRQFRQDFFTELKSLIGEEGSIEHAKSVEFSSLGTVHHKIDITPCFSFTHTTSTGKVRGVLIYDKEFEMDILSFPSLHAQNGNAKDIATNGNFKTCVRMFKSIYARMVKHQLIQPNLATGYYIECLLYNVPNNLFLVSRGVPEFLNEMRDKQPKSRAEMLFAKIFNYLLHANFEDFSCQNHVWSLFGPAREFWHIEDAQSFLGAVFHFSQIGALE